MSTTILMSPDQSKQQATPSIDLIEIFKCISDDKSLTLFNSVAHMNEKSELLISKLNMTRKQFYARMERLSRQGLIMRTGGQHQLTTLGKIIYHLQNTIGRQQRQINGNCVPSTRLLVRTVCHQMSSYFD